MDINKKFTEILDKIKNKKGLKPEWREPKGTIEAFARNNQEIVLMVKDGYKLPVTFENILPGELLFNEDLMDEYSNIINYFYVTDKSGDVLECELFNQAGEKMCALFEEGKMNDNLYRVAPSLVKTILEFYKQEDILKEFYPNSPNSEE